VSDSATNDVARLYLALGRLTRAMRRDSSEALVGHGALSALATLINDGPQRAGALAETEGVTAPAMTRILNSLEQLGYVVRRPDPDDGRASVVAVTAPGKALVSGGRAVRLRALEDRLSALPADERRALLAVLPVLEKLGDA
jgi:DNA-binding MarR family transcriptional regulator